MTPPHSAHAERHDGGAPAPGAPGAPDDMALATRVADGDRDALAEIFRRYRRFVHAVAWKVTFDEDDALDVTQAVFLGLMRKIGGYSGRGEFRSWLAAVTTREALDLLRRGHRRETAVEPERLARILEARSRGAGLSGAADPREAIERSQRLARVEAAMGELSAQQRAVLALHVSHDLAPREIGARLGIPPKQVSGQIRRSIVKLRASLLGIEAATDSRADASGARRALRAVAAGSAGSLDGTGRVASPVGGVAPPYHAPGGIRPGGDARIASSARDAEGGSSMARTVEAMSDVLDYVLGETTGAARAAFERELARDPDRTALVAGFRRALADAREWNELAEAPGAARLEVATPDGLEAIPRGRPLAERIAAARPRRRRARVDWRRLERILRWALTVALAAILVGAAWIGLHR